MFGTKSRALVCGFIISVLFSFVSFSNKCEGISNKVFRLHIIANSDSAEDQALKLKVRDRILNDFGDKFKYADDLLSAERITNENIEMIKNLARDEITQNGYNYSVNAEISNMYFNTRRYGEITLPAGRYDALRISIGSAKGKNWWCVMFPPMCLPAAQEKAEMGSVLNPSELDVVQGEQRYKVCFKIVEFFSEAKSFFQTRIWNPIEKFADDSLLNIPRKYDMDLRLAHVFSEITNSNKDV